MEAAQLRRRFLVLQPLTDPSVLDAEPAPLLATPAPQGKMVVDKNQFNEQIGLKIRRAVEAKLGAKVDATLDRLNAEADTFFGRERDKMRAHVGQAINTHLDAVLSALQQDQKRGAEAVLRAREALLAVLDHPYPEGEQPARLNLGREEPDTDGDAAAGKQEDGA